MLFKIPVKPRSEVLTTSATLNPLRFATPEYTHWTATTAAQTHTLPTASNNLAGYVMGFANASNGSVTLSGSFVIGSSIVLETGSSILLICVPTSGTTHKWMAIGASSALTGLSETIADAVGAMVTSNTETGISVTYDDADNTLDFTISDEYIQDLAAAMLTGGTHTNAAFTYHDDTGLIDLSVTAPTTEAVQDIVGAMFTGNTETGCSVDYQDDDGTIDVVVSYGSSAGTACQGNDARLPTTEEKTAFISYYRTGLTGGTAADLDGVAYASCTNGMRAHVKAAGVLYVYLFDSTSAAAESSPTVIKPDDAGASNGRWILQTIPGQSQAYGTSSTTACVGNDGRLPTAGEKSALAALVSSVNWQDFVPTIASVPATDSLVARYQRVGNTVHFYIDVRGSDGDAWTPSTITLPVTPSDVNALIPLRAIQMHNTSTYLDPLAYVDAETSTYPIKFRAAAAATNAAPWSLQIAGSYEVAAA